MDRLRDAERLGLGGGFPGGGGGGGAFAFTDSLSVTDGSFNLSRRADGLPVEVPMRLQQRLESYQYNGARGEGGQQAGQKQRGQPNASIAIRSNFNPLAAFAPAVRTDASGRATIDVRMPDNLTRYRIIAIATAGDKQYGKGESPVTARLPLMVRPSPPRFLNFGDTFMLPVVVQNQTDDPMVVKIAARATNATLTDGAGREVSVPANDRVEVRFPAAAEMPGTARFQIVGASGSSSDAAELALPVWTPATTEAFAKPTASSTTAPRDRPSRSPAGS
jgi:uncharacterized protein YfaS (alpha-2-macroglobulin family)